MSNCFSRTLSGCATLGVAFTFFFATACNSGAKTDAPPSSDPIAPIKAEELRLPRETAEDAPLPVIESAKTREIEALLAEADALAEAGKVDDALITLWQVRLREPWHLDAHLKYQDLRLRRWSPERLYGEYRPLFGAEMENPIALFLMLRPLLLKATSAEAGATRVSPEAAAKASTLYHACVEASRSKSAKDARPHFDALFAVVPLHVAGHRLWQDIVMLADYDVSGNADAVEHAIAEEMKRRGGALRVEYATLLRAHETDGDARYLYERVAGLDDPVASSARFARDYLSGINSFYLMYGLAKCAVDRAVAASNDGHADGHRAMLLLAELCYGTCIRGDVLQSGEAYYGRGFVYEGMGEYDAAAADYERANQLLNWSDPELLLTWAQLLRDQRKHGAAVELLAEAQKRYPTDLAFVTESVDSLVSLGRLADALTLCRKTAAEPNLPPEAKASFDRVAAALEKQLQSKR